MGCSAHQSWNCGLASLRASTISEKRGLPGWRPAAAWHWLSTVLAADSQWTRQIRLAGPVNIIQGMLRRLAGSAPDQGVGFVPHHVVEALVIDRGHDANVVATMLAHGVGTVVTMNLADFARFERYLSLVEL